ncbi:MAG: class I SAM-dependent methyltransferase [Pseudomonadota bacterium]
MTSGQPNKELMLMNWPERVWIYSPVRVYFQRLHAKKWLRFAGRQKPGLSLEIGCGLGKAAHFLVEEMGFEKVVAFDLEEKLIRRAARALPKAMGSRISYFVSDAQDLPFADSAFDAVVNYGIIHHVLDWRKCVSEIGRVTKPGGIFYFEEIYPPLYANAILKRLVRHPTEDRFHAPEFLAALRTAGFSLMDGVNTRSKFGIVGTARRL